MSCCLGSTGCCGAGPRTSSTAAHTRPTATSGLTCGNRSSGGKSASTGARFGRSCADATAEARRQGRGTVRPGKGTRGTTTTTGERRSRSHGRAPHEMNHDTHRGRWRARCAERRTPGSGGDTGKPTGSDTGRAPRVDFTMTTSPALAGSGPPERRPAALPGRPAAVASAVAAAGSVLYLLIRPQAPDLAAQLARAQAAARGVTLWWNGWYGGIATPDYSVLTTPLMRDLGVVVVGVLSTVAVAAAAGGLLAGSRRPRAGAAVAAAGAAANLYSARHLRGRDGARPDRRLPADPRPDVSRAADGCRLGARQPARRPVSCRRVRRGGRDRASPPARRRAAAGRCGAARARGRARVRPAVGDALRPGHAHPYPGNLRRAVPGPGAAGRARGGAAERDHRGGRVRDRHPGGQQRRTPADADRGRRAGRHRSLVAPAAGGRGARAVRLAPDQPGRRPSARGGRLRPGQLLPAAAGAPARGRHCRATAGGRRPSHPRCRCLPARPGAAGPGLGTPDRRCGQSALLPAAAHGPRLPVLAAEPGRGLGRPSRRPPGLWRQG